MKKVFLFIFSVFSFHLMFSEFSIEKLSTYKNLLPVAIIGGGSAGLSAAIYSARANLKTVVFMGETPGGQLTETTFVENIPGIGKKTGTEIIQELMNEAQGFGAKLVYKNIIDVNFSEDENLPHILTTDLGEKIYALSIIISTGSTHKMLGIPGEAEFLGKGVSTCALCDCLCYEDMNVAIVGGGDTAIEYAFQLSPYAKNITIFVRKNEMRASSHMQRKLADYNNVNVIYNKEILEIFGNGETVTKIKVNDTITNVFEIMPIDGIFLAIGHSPSSELFKDKLKLSHSGHVVVDSYQATNINGVYAAGEIADDVFRQAVTAFGDGAKAGIMASKYLIDNGFTQKFSNHLEHLFYVTN